jgi:hypothetical protein
MMHHGIVVSLYNHPQGLVHTNFHTEFHKLCTHIMTSVSRYSAFEKVFFLERKEFVPTNKFTTEKGHVAQNFYWEAAKLGC